MTTMNVILNLYNLHESNNALHSIGLGFYHTGVEVGSYEYSFSEAGISRTRPRLPEFGGLREQINMGIFQGGLNELTNLVGTLGAEGCEFGPGRYNLTTLNCNHFSDSFCMLLVDKHIPDWINRMAGIGAGLVPPNKTGAVKPDNEGFAALGKVSNPGDIRTVNEDRPVASSTTNSQWSIFNIFGSSSSASSVSASSSISSAPAATNNKTQNVTTKSSGSNAKSNTNKKELTDKQREMLNNLRKH